ncbi:hypothetical protein JCM10450v2_002572 [Rhodotorula kratochvilovae]
MRYTIALSLIALTASFVAADSPVAADQSPAPQLEKRACFLGICSGPTTPNYQSDVNNCGTAGNKCPTGWANGSGSQCNSGVCYPGSCNSGYTLNTATRSCVNTVSDPNNCGSIGHVCSTTNGVAGCSSGSCTIASCNPGYKLTTTYGFLGLSSSTSCAAVNTASDVNNCGAVGKVCTFPNGGGTCSSGVCATTSCNNGFYLVNGQCTTLNLATDVNNCGGVGNRCSAANGVAQCSSGSCSIASCNVGYTLTTSYTLLGLLGSSTSCTAVNTASDVNNCGAVGNKCSFTNGGGTCSSGQCTYTSCNNGFYQVNGQCTALNLFTDVNNCGAVGRVCSYDNAVAQCITGTCSLASCNPGYKQQTSYALLGLLGSSTSCAAVDTTSDVNNCGTVGKVCSFSNGAGTCSNGQCAYTSCNSGYYQVNGVCTSLNLQSDINNCGAVGRVCPTSLGSATCSAGSCKYTSCTSGYTLSSGQCTQVNTQTDVNNCGRVGNVCPSTYANGGSSTCVSGACTTSCKSGFSFDSTYNFCRDVSSDTSNCGSIGNKCAVAGASAQICSSGACQATSCSSGLTLTNGACKTVDFSADINNCGSLGNVCKFSPNGAAGTCSAGKCVITSCPTGYIVSNGACVLSASGKARVKKSKITKPKTLCPTGESACPIVGSTSFEGAVKQLSATEFSGMMAGSGGYECIDTLQALDSCGGCASTGEGQDCTKIRGAAGVGCSAGTCVVFSCQAGYKPSLSGDRCVRTRSSHHGASNHTSTGGAKRHLAARQHGSAAFH